MAAEVKREEANGGSKNVSDEKIRKKRAWEGASRQRQESLNVAQLKREELVREGG